MSARKELVVGWCPGALRPMQSGDGLIVRIRPRFGRLSLVQLETLARTAQKFGDGNLHLSNRANVHIRGVTDAGHAGVLEALAAVGLIDSDPRVEAVRNIMVCPSAGLSVHEELADGLAAKLQDVLARNEVLYELPAKFGIAVQCGDEIDLASTSDLTFLVQDERIVMLLEGDLGQGFLFDGTGDAVEGFFNITLAFLSLRREKPGLRRMRDAVAQVRIEALAEEAELEPVSHGIPPVYAPPPVGELDDAFGIAFAFGEITHAEIDKITHVMRRECIAEAALSPHHALVFQGPRAAFSDLARQIGGITDPADIRLRVHACAGAPGCARATVQARHDAKEVLRVLAKGDFPKGTVHVSGCEKRCAYRHEADVTAIGADGRYTVTGPRSQTRNDVRGAKLAAVIAEFAA